VVQHETAKCFIVIAGGDAAVRERAATEPEGRTGSSWCTLRYRRVSDRFVNVVSARKRYIDSIRLSKAVWR
jgi:hypothetical protein